MYHNTIIKGMFTAIVVCITSLCFSQTSLQREYWYDESGNRVCRKVVEVPANTPRNLSQPIEEISTTFFHEHVCSYSCKIYPNPTTGQIQLDIEDLTTSFQGMAALYSVHGVFLRDFKISESHNVFDLSDLPPGMYILRLNINEKTEEWKIIKR
jgi:hypothetical protein